RVLDVHCDRPCGLKVSFCPAARKCCDMSSRAQEVVIIDNGGANTASLQFALERVGCNAELTRDPKRVTAATHVILPGVGSAADAMRRLRASGLDEVIPRITRPLLGICL